MTFISYACLISLVITSSTVLNRSYKSCKRHGCPCLFPDLRGKAFCLLSYYVCCGFSCMAFIMWGTFLLFLLWVFFFIMKGSWISSDAFSNSSGIHVFFLHFVDVIYWLIFLYVEPSLYSRINPIWSFCIIFNMLMNSVLVFC